MKFDPEILLGPEISMFRAHYDVMLGPKAMKAHMLSSPECRAYKMRAWLAHSPQGVYVELTRNGKSEAHFVPTSLIESVCITTDLKERVGEEEEPTDIKRGPGRAKSQAI